MDTLANNPLLSPASLRDEHEAAWHWARWLLDGDRDAADEVMQMVYLQILEGRARYRGKASVKTWLFAVVRNVARRERRRVLRDAGRRASGSEVPEAPEAPVENGEPLADGRRRAALQAAIAGLPERQRELLQLVVHRECTLEEAARILRIRLGSARTHYHRAKAALRDRLDENL